MVEMLLTSLPISTSSSQNHIIPLLSRDGHSKLRQTWCFCTASANGFESDDNGASTNEFESDDNDIVLCFGFSFESKSIFSGGLKVFESLASVNELIP